MLGYGDVARSQRARGVGPDGQAGIHIRSAKGIETTEGIRNVEIGDTGALAVSLQLQLV